MSVTFPNLRTAYIGTLLIFLRFLKYFFKTVRSKVEALQPHSLQVKAKGKVVPVL